MDLSYNNLTGDVPSWLWELPSLTRLNLSGNHLEDHLPGYLFAKRALEYLDLSDNFFNGSILPFVGLNLMTLILSGNNLRGAFSSSICSPYIEILDLSSNKLSGSLPSSLANCSSLGVLKITNNDFDGQIPQDIGNITSLGILHMNDNKLRGSLPSSLSLTGELPTNFSGLQTMINQSNHAYLIGYNYYFAHLFFENDIDLFNKGQQMQYQKILSIFTLIDLSDNQLTGKIPEELGVLKALISMNISRNNLTGEMPGFIGDIQDLESLDLSHSLLTEPITDSLGNLDMLGYLDLSYNNFVWQARHLDTFGGLS
ncbi:hypothetical protein SUGI_0366600 [Cryptomeria japonica]|nr:hypothetical protein SUGI_0366600 [Cryptomeria japonica]